MQANKIKVAVIGFGNSAKTFHLPFILASDQFELVAISSSQQNTVLAAYPEINCYDDAEDLITQSNADLVVITAPNHVHFSLAKLALEHKRHVILEKPMANTSEEAQQLVELAKRKQLHLSVFQNRRWDGDFLTVKKLISNKQLGDIKYFESHFDRFRPQVQQRWREEAGIGNGIWYDLGSHLVDQTLQLFGLPVSVSARILAVRENAKAVDYAHVCLHYDNLEVVLHVSVLAAAPNQRFRLDGTKGSYIKHGLDPQEDQLKAKMSPLDEQFGVEDESAYGSLFEGSAIDNRVTQKRLVTENGTYQAFYAQMAEAINTGADVPVKPSEVVDVIKIIELANKSHELKQTLSFK